MNTAEVLAQLRANTRRGLSLAQHQVGQSNYHTLSTRTRHVLSKSLRLGIFTGWCVNCGLIGMTDDDGCPRCTCNVRVREASDRSVAMGALTMDQVKHITSMRMLA